MDSPVPSCLPWLLHCLLMEVQINPTFPLLAGLGRKVRCCRAPSLLCPHFPTPQGQVTRWSSPGAMTPMGALWRLLRRSGVGGEPWQHPARPCRGWGWALVPSQPGDSFSPVLRGRRSAGPLPGTVPRGTVLRRLRLPEPGIKEQGEAEDAPGTGPEHRGQPGTGSA